MFDARTSTRGERCTAPCGTGMQTALTSLPALARLDVSGCPAIRGHVSVPPAALALSSLRTVGLPGLVALTVQLPAAAALHTLAVSAGT